MRPTKYSQKAILDLLYREKVLTKEMILQMSGCSTMTAWRILKAHGYITSYNYNATYYTLADIPLFDKYGLWAYREVRFSKYGSLTNTVKALVCNSPAGMTASEIQQLLNVNVTPILARFYRQGKLYRKKVNAVLVYFQPNKQDYGWQKQFHNRKEQDENERLGKTQSRLHLQLQLPEPEQIIAVLVELIQLQSQSQTVEFELQSEQFSLLSRRLSRKGVHISSSQVQTILLHYQLTKKKHLTS